MSELTDIFGQPVKVGDYIAAGMAFNRSSVLRVGIVTAIEEKPINKWSDNSSTYWSVKVRWTHNGKDSVSSWDVKESRIRIEPSYNYAKFVLLPSGYAEQFPEDNPVEEA